MESQVLGMFLLFLFVKVDQLLLLTSVHCVSSYYSSLTSLYFPRFLLSFQLSALQFLKLSPRLASFLSASFFLTPPPPICYRRLFTSLHVFPTFLTQKRCWCTFFSLGLQLCKLKNDPATTFLGGKSIATLLAFIFLPLLQRPSTPAFVVLLLLLLLFRLAGGAGSGLPCPFFHPENTLLPPPTLLSRAEYRAQC